MRSNETLSAVVLGALAVLSGCGGGGSSGPTTTEVVPVPPTVASSALPALRGALLSAPDVPGAAPVTPGRRTDLSSCFPGNPAGARNNPNEVVGPTLAVVQGKLQRTYSSSATDAGPKQAAAYVATFASPAGSACLISVIKAAMSAQAGPTADVSGVTASVKPLAIADAGAALVIKGTIKANGSSTQAAFDLVAFHKGQVVVLLSAGTVGGPPVAGQGADLARKIAVRLP